MSNTDKPQGPARVEGTFDSDGAVSAEFTSRVGDPTIQDSRGGRTFEPGVQDLTEEELAALETGEEPQGRATQDAEPEGEDTQAGGDAGDAPADLGAYDPANEEVRAAFNERYFQTEGEGEAAVTSLNRTAFTEEWDRNGGKLNDSTYAFVEDTFGLSKDATNEIAEGLQLKREATEAAFYQGVEGGKEGFQSMLTWASGGGYSAAQKARFNTAMDKGGDEAQDAIAALTQRFKAAGGKTPAQHQEEAPRRTPRGRPGAPARQAGGAAPATAGQSGPAPFENLEEHRLAQAEAIRSRDPKKIAEVRKRLQNSPKLFR